MVNHQLKIINKMNAQEAKKLTEESLVGTTESQLSLILEKIRNAAAKGNSDKCIGEIHPLVKSKLIELGYKVEYFSGDPRERDPSFYQISWL